MYDSSKLTEQHILHLFAFCTVLVQLLQRGFTTYSSPRYRQFGKRLGRLIRHTVQYASDQWHSFRYKLICPFISNSINELCKADVYAQLAKIIFMINAISLLNFQCISDIGNA